MNEGLPPVNNFPPTTGVGLPPLPSVEQASQQTMAPSQPVEPPL